MHGHMNVNFELLFRKHNKSKQQLECVSYNFTLAK